jgi:hypothetical protein
VEERGIPAPFTLALGEGATGGALFALNGAAIKLRRQLFAYQALFVASPRPSLEFLLSQAQAESEVRSSALDAAAGR